MRKRLLIGLLSAGLLGAMLPGVASARVEPPIDEYRERILCNSPGSSVERLYLQAGVMTWPPGGWRHRLSDELRADMLSLAEALLELELDGDWTCRIAGVRPIGGNGS